MFAIKLTDGNNVTCRCTGWGPGITHTVEGPLEMCRNGIHFYQGTTEDHALFLARILGPTHIMNWKPKAWRAIACEDMIRTPTKSVTRSLTTVEEAPFPEVPLWQRIRFALLCALRVESDTKWRKWAIVRANSEDYSDCPAFVPDTFGLSNATAYATQFVYLTALGSKRNSYGNWAVEHTQHKVQFDLEPLINLARSTEPITEENAQCLI